MDAQIQKLLDKFWSKAGRPLSRGERLSERRMKLLKEYAGIVVFHRKRERRNELRKKFNRRHRHPSGLCWCCSSFDGIRERHHILQLQHGGPNHRRNIVTICAGCHEKVHPWMVGASVPQLEEAQHKPIWA